MIDMKLSINESFSEVELAGIQYWLDKNCFERDDYAYNKDMPDDISITFLDMDDYYICEIADTHTGKLYAKEKCYSLKDMKDYYKNYVEYVDEPEIDYSDDEIDLPDDYSDYDFNEDEYEDDPFGGSRWGDVSTVGRLF
jgi:hypothetical protein